MRSLFLIFALTSLILTGNSQNTRHKSNLNKGWEFQKTTSGQWTDSSPLEKINLPHTWNATDVVDHDPGYYRGKGIYKKAIQVTIKKGTRYLLYFEGANITTTVFVNGVASGKHIGGYVGFNIDITNNLVEGSNELEIHVTNEVDRSIIPSQKSDFFIYGGITRDLWLVEVPENIIEDIYLQDPQTVTGDPKVFVELNASSLKKGNVHHILLSPDNKEVHRGSTSFDSKTAAQPIEISFPTGTFKARWSPKTPQRYTLHTFLISKKDTLDLLTRKLGVKHAEFRENGAFFLNGERLLLRGTHRHEEHAGQGAALSNEQHIKDIVQIKDMGANFVRLAHYPQDPVVYDACDSLGLLIWDELPWCRGGVGDAAWQNNTKRLLQEQIIQNRHHPSILLWSMGNEVYWEADYENGSDNSALRSFLSELTGISKNLDPSRSTAIRKYYEGADLVDVFSPSIWSGWYRGVYTDYKSALEDSRTKYPRFLHMEYGGASHLGRHTSYPISGEGMHITPGWEEDEQRSAIKNIAKEGDWSENYIVDLFDWHLHVSENLPWFTGSAQWAMKDFGTPLRPENAIPYINQKGIVDRAGNPKDAFYVFKAHWTDNCDFVYIESPTWKERVGQDNASNELCVFSNCSKVQLWLNGEKAGIRIRDKSEYPAQGLAWDLKFKTGQNTLIAQGYDQSGKTVTSSDTLRFTYVTTASGPPSALSVTLERLDSDWLQITATITDASGQICSDYNELIYFAYDGTGELLKFQGTPNGSDIIEMANGRATILLKHKATDNGTVSAYNQNFKGTYLHLPPLE